MRIASTLSWGYVFRDGRREDAAACTENSSTENSSTETHAEAEPTLFRRPENLLEGSEKVGAVPIDLDEGAHGAYVAFKYGAAFVRDGSFNAVVKDVREETTQFTSAPEEWLRAQTGQPSSVNSVIDFGMSGAIMALSVCAIKAGVEETNEAVHIHRKLNERRIGIEENLGSLSARQKSTPSRLNPGVAHLYAQKIETQSLAAINGALRHNYYDGGIGCSSLVSGGAIFTKVAQDTALHAVTMTISKSCGLTAATTVLGIVGTLVLGPLAAVAAVALGGFFVHKARMVGKELAEDRRLIEKVARKERGGVELVKKAYRKFIERKFTSRENFATRFRRWNSGFLGGACLYAISAGAKAALGVAALAGFSAAISTPIVFGLTFGLGLAGGIAMSACSWQFLTSHGKSKRQQAYRLAETPFLGRCFDAIQTIHAWRNLNMASGLRAELYDFISKRDRARQCFLQARAEELKKFRAWEQRATDDPATDGLISKTRQRSRNLMALVSFVAAYVGQRFSGAPHQAAAQEAAQVYAKGADDLTTVGLTRWLNGNDGASTLKERESAQRKLLATMLAQQKHFLEIKRGAYQRVGRSLTDASASVPQVQQTFSPAQEEARADRVRLKKIDSVLENIIPLELNVLKRDFLHLQGLDPAGLPGENETAALNARLAQYLITDLSEELTTTRGILFDMHRRSVHLQRELQAA